MSAWLYRIGGAVVLGGRFIGFSWRAFPQRFRLGHADVRLSIGAHFAVLMADHYC
jgi:hypothetical protein